MKKFREIPICTCQTPKNVAKSEKNQEKIKKILKNINDQKDNIKLISFCCR